MNHSVKIQQNEVQQSSLMKDTIKIMQKFKTKGRFQVEIPTNGYMNRTDMLWAQKANPSAHAARVYRE